MDQSKREQLAQIKATAYLKKLIKTKEWGITSKGERMQKAKAEGWIVEIDKKPSVKYDRRKYNRMNWEEQKEYERKMDILVPEYQLRKPGESTYYEITKTEYEYFNTL